MWKVSSGSAVTLTLALVACTDATPDSGDTQHGAEVLPGDPDCNDGDGDGSGSGEEALCLDRTPTGDVLWSFPLGTVYYLSAADVVVDSLGEAVYSRGGSTSFGLGRVTTKVSTFGTLIYQREIGGEIAGDANRNVYVAGPFGSPMDLGLGTMTPAGIGSVYVAKLGPLGFTEWVRDVRFPTDATQVEQGPIDIAVTPDGTLFAVSSLLGTVVFDVTGREHFRTPYMGEVEFTAEGHLVIAANIYNSDGNSRAVIVRFDEHGCVLWRQLLADPNERAGATFARDLALDANGDVVVVGDIGGGALIFGERVEPSEQMYGEIPLRFAGFVIKLTADGNLVWKRFDDNVELTLGVAIDPLGAIVVTGSEYTTVGAHATAFIDKLDASGQLIWAKTGVLGNIESNGASVATDACGDVLWVANAFIPFVDTPSYLIRLAL